ncbi:MAG TPA: ribonuclease HI family protein [Anaeromyxobacteraceae bacterium]|nr:ribonuclease HI family protein [Anaeromyxobacteraceae bacterium]
MAKPVLAELLRFIAANEELPRSLQRYKGYDRDTLGKLIAAAADRVEQAEAVPDSPPPARTRPGVRRAAEGRPAAASANPEPAARTRLFTDGAARGNPGPAGAGAVIVSPQGHIVAKVGKFLGDNTNNYAEYMGLILGLKRAKAMGIKALDVFADSELLVRQLNGEYQVKAENLRPLHEEARRLLTAFPGVKLRHIRREENEAADEMSNRAIDERL